MQEFALPWIFVTTFLIHFTSSASFSFKILPMHRESCCGLSWFWFLFPSSKPGIEMSGRVTHSFITQIYPRHCPHLHGQCWAPAPILQLLKGERRRQVSDHTVLLPFYLIESTGTWAREKGKWSVFVGCRSRVKEDGENGL